MFAALRNAARETLLLLVFIFGIVPMLILVVIAWKRGDRDDME